MSHLHFEKYQGLGNDFIVIDSASLVHTQDLPTLARQLCDRHFGIGADGLLIHWPSTSADARMQILNADGSEPEMCGNGLRCFFRYLQEHSSYPLQTSKIETQSGLREAYVEKEFIRVDMGHPQYSEPFDRPLKQTPFRATPLSMGNPHCVIRVPNFEQLDFAYWGPYIETHPDFPNRTNVEFIVIEHSQRVHVKVWERGAGPTLACGTGACAVVVAGILNGWLDQQVEVLLPGGILQIDWPNLDESVLLSGPARRVFQGKWE